MPRQKPEYMCLKLSLEEARAEVALLRIRMQRYGCTCKGSLYQEVSDHICKLLAYIQYKENKERKARRQLPL